MSKSYISEILQYSLFKKYKKLISILLCTYLYLITFLGFQNFNYKSFFLDFKAYFDSNKFIEAQNHLINNCNINIFRKILLEDNLSNYFKNKVYEINNNLNNNIISNDEAFVIINEINKYNLLNSEIKETISVISNNVSDESFLTKGILEYQKGNFQKSIKFLSYIEKDDISYTTANNYIKKSKSELKSNILKEADELANKDYYSKGINLLEDNIKILDNDSDILNKIESLKEKKYQYLSNKNSNFKGDPSISTSAIVSSISTSTINNIWLESLTPYLIFVDQTSQKTFIYKGKVNNWTLEKEMICSTGIKGRETPSGVFDIREKGTWFFSDKYDQGGKYYTQFKDNYLFHSIPYAKDSETIVDDTLGKPASHGCIRLNLDDAKWIYDNIPKGTKVIIN